MPRLALIQTSARSDPAGNLRRGLERCKEAILEGADIIAFPELAFTTFFPQQHLTGDRFRFSESIPGPTTDAFCDLAARTGTVVIPNLFERDGNRAFDSSPMIDADGSILGVTRMLHITQYEGFYEQEYYDPGDSGCPVYDTAHGRIGVCICYDRHYPEVLRTLGLGGAELVIVPQAGVTGEWPQGVFEAELQAGSFQNGYYMALANRVGKEDQLEFAGESFVTDPMGQIIARAPFGEESVLYCDILFDSIAFSPARQLFYRHRRPDLYTAGSIR